MTQTTRSLERACLVIIDMQPTFEASQEPWLIENVKREIRQAKKRKEPILLVRYHGGSQDRRKDWQIDPRLLRTIGTYTKVFPVIKHRADGSQKIIGLLNRKRLPKKNIKVVGVNTDACVASTVNSLAERMPLSSIWVVADACHTDVGTSRYSGRAHISRRKNIRRVNIDFRPTKVKIAGK
jgi:nicotinamidase-related amidase